MNRLVVTTVVRGSSPGESHGGIYIVDLDDEEVYQAVDWRDQDIDWRDHEGDRGLRGIAIHKNRVFVAAGGALLEFSSSFELVATHRNAYLKHCHGIDVFENHLFITSAEFDSILAFNLRTNAFEQGLMVKTDGQSVSMGQYDPNTDAGPLAMNKFRLNNVQCEKGGMYISGLKTEGLLLYNGTRIGLSATMPNGVHDVMPFRDGFLLNDSEGDVLRYVSPAGNHDCYFLVPVYPVEDLVNTDTDDPRAIRQGFGRGLCIIDDQMVAAGSSPATVSLYDLDQKQKLKSINWSMDVRNTVHSIAIWPFA